MYSEDDLLPISALQHLMFCGRQCALIHIEQVWQENRLTAEGRILHEHVHEKGSESRGDVRIVRGLRLRSLRLGVSGIADVVEFWGDADKPASQIANVKHENTTARVVPVEYKRGKPKPDDCDKAQLCAQAMCLEEMLNVKVSEGAIFYGQPRRRLVVQLSESLRERVIELAARLHELIDAGVTPPAVMQKKCHSCSLVDLCLPATTASGKSVARYMGQMLTV